MIKVSFKSVAILCGLLFLSACQSTKYTLQEIQSYNMADKSYDELFERATTIFDNYLFEKDLDSVAHAADLYEAAIKKAAATRPQTKKSVFNWAHAQFKLGLALNLLAKKTKKKHYFLKSTVSLKKANSVLLPNNEDWAKTQLHISNAMAYLGRHEKNVAYLNEAETSAKNALGFWIDDDFLFQQALVKRNLAEIEIGKGIINNKPSHFRNAISTLKDSIDTFNRGISTYAYSEMQTSLGDAYHYLGVASKNKENFKKAIEAYKEARSVLWEKEDAVDWQMNTKNIARSEAALLN